MAADRMAPGRERAHQILALDLARRHHFPPPRRHRQLRWRIERAYQELKQEVGLGHFEGRGWRGFHHHATLCIAAYGFLISERETIPPSRPRSTRQLAKLAVPGSYRPRGSAASTRTARSEFDRDNAPEADHSSRHDVASMPMLCGADRKINAAEKFVTQ